MFISIQLILCYLKLILVIPIFACVLVFVFAIAIFACIRRKINAKPLNNQLIYSLNTENNSAILNMNNEDLSIASIPSYKPSFKSSNKDIKKKEEELPTYDDFVKKTSKY